MGKQEKLGAGLRIAYGIGGGADGIKANAFNAFLLFYYQQILGLEAIYGGIALFIAILFDAITDPLMGAISDSTRTRWGRRHPYMFASVLPLVFCYFAVFNAPSGLTQLRLFLWLLTFSVGTRLSMTLFLMPLFAMLPQLTRSYGERAALAAARTGAAWLFGVINFVVAVTFFLRATPEYPQGLLNPEGYFGFSVFGALVIGSTILISSYGTYGALKRKPTGKHKQPAFSFKALLGDFAQLLKGKAFRCVVPAGLLFGVGFGAGEALRLYVNTYIWGFTSEQLAAFALSILVAAVLANITTKPLVQRYGKRRAAVGLCIVALVCEPTVLILRLWDILPGRGEAILLYVLVPGFAVILWMAISLMSITMSMYADITDEHELVSGNRQEGLISSVASFSIKMTGGLGTVVAAIVLSLVGFGIGITPETADPQMVRRFTYAALTLPLIGWPLLAIVYCQYPLGRERLAEIHAELDRRALKRD